MRTMAWVAEVLVWGSGLLYYRFVMALWSKHPLDAVGMWPVLEFWTQAT